MIEKFIEYILYGLGYSKNTAFNYHHSLILFEKFLKNSDHSLEKPKTISYEDINRFIISQKDLSNKTKNCRLAAIKNYLNWLLDNNIKVIDPSRIKCLKEEDKAIGFFSDVQKKRILKLVDDGLGNTDEIKLRNKLLVYILMFTGLRIQEALDIKTKDVQEAIQIIGKGRVLRWTFLRPEILDIAKDYLNTKRHYSDYLFSTVAASKHSKIGMQLNQTTTQLFFIKMSKLLGFHVHAHKFRHTYATGLLRLKGSNIYNIAKLLGHKNISTTQVYLGYNDNELKKLQFSLKI